MARTKSANTTSVVAKEQAAEVAQTENAADVVETPAVEEPKKEDKSKDKKAEDKPIKDDDKVVIVCAAYAGKSVVLPTRTIQLDEKGCCEVTGIEAKRLLTIPGYERKN